MSIRLIIIASTFLILVIMWLLIYVSFFSPNPTEGVDGDSPVSVTDPFGSSSIETSGSSVDGEGSATPGTGSTAPGEGVLVLNDAAKKMLTYVQAKETAYESDDGVFYLLGEAEQATSSAFTVIIAEYGMLYVRLEEAPIGKSRRLAQDFILSNLGLSEAELCTLDYRIFPALGVDPNHEDENVGFTFCEGSVVLREI